MISCQHHDYVEIACLYRLPVSLALKSGKTIEGVALDTRCNSSHDECIMLKTADGETLVVLDEIHTMTAAKPNPYFEHVDFTADP